jgi:hypothetical protein
MVVSLKPRKKVAAPSKGALINIRMSEAMLNAVQEAVVKHPIEFENVTQFCRTAIRNELERRKLI